MAKKSSVEKNNRRAKRSKQFASRWQKLRDVARRLADGLRGDRMVEYGAEFALPLSANSICMLLGLDPSLATHFKRWSDIITNFTPDGKISVIGGEGEVEAARLGRRSEGRRVADRRGAG